MKKIVSKISAVFLIILSLFSVIGFFGVKKIEKSQKNATAYNYELSSSYLENLNNDTSTLESSYNLANILPLVNENQTNSNFCWIYAGMKSLETLLMIQKNEYYNFSEVGSAYLYYANNVETSKSIGFNASGFFEDFVNCYQDSGLILESDFSNTEFESIANSSEKYEYYNYIKQFATNEFNSKVKPYQISELTYFTGLDKRAQRNVIKRFVKKYGSVFCAIEGNSNTGSEKGCFYDDYNAQNNTDNIYTFYDDERERHKDAMNYYTLSQGHAISIVGWNDNIHFSSETGAFIAMNSWGFESNSRSFFYIPYSYVFCYSTFRGFVCDEETETDISILESEPSSFSSEILGSSNELKNYFCYDDEISLTYKLKLDSFENMKVKVTGGKTDYSDKFKVVYNSENSTIKVDLLKGPEFYGGNYTVSFYNGDVLFGKREIFVFSGTEIGNIKSTTLEADSSFMLDTYILNNAFLNKDDIATINVSGPRDYYRFSFNLAVFTSNQAILKSSKKDNWKNLNFSVTEISVVSSDSSAPATRYTDEELQSLFEINTSSDFANKYILQIGHALTLSQFKNTMIRFKIKVDSVLYDCSREYTINMFVSERTNARTYDLYSINYFLNDGENDSRNITKYPRFIKMNTVDTDQERYLDPNMTEVPLYAPTKVGSNFVGWYLTEDFSGEPVDKIDKNLVGNIKLYAKWEEISTDYYGISLSLISAKDYDGNPKSISDDFVYGDSLVIRFNFTEKAPLSGYNYTVNYYFNGAKLLDGYLTGDYQDFNLDFPDLKSGNQTFRLKVVVAISKNLSVTKETSIRINIAKKEVRFGFENLSQIYNGSNLKPSVVMTEDFYAEDKVNKQESDLFVLSCDTESKNVGNYRFYISQILNTNYEFVESEAVCNLAVTPKGIILNWKEYNQVYDGQNHFPEYDILGIIEGDAVGFSFTIDECINAGTYRINIKPETITNGNYTVGNVEDFVFEIKKASIRIIIHNTTDRVQTISSKRATPTFMVVGNYYSIDDLQLNIKTEGKVAQVSGKFSITCEVGNKNYEATVQKATYTLTGFYYVYYQLANGSTYVERVEEGQTPKGVTKENLSAPLFSKIVMSDEYQITGDDIYVLVSIKDYSATVYSIGAIVLFGIICLIVYLKKRGSSVR